MTDAIRRMDFEQAAACRHYSPAVVVDLVVTVPAEEGHVGYVGRSALRDRTHMVVVAQRRVGPAPAAAPVAGDERLMLGGGGTSFGDATPQRDTVRPVECAPGCRPRSAT